MTHVRLMRLSAGLLTAVLAACIASEGKASESKVIRSFMDGHELHRLCNSSVSWENTRCSSYIVGVADVLVASGYHEMRACLPDNIDAAQARDVVVLWLDQRPQHRHYTAASLTAAALSEAFPCKN
jgi:hypothetical protein